MKRPLPRLLCSLGFSAWVLAACIASSSATAETLRVSAGESIAQAIEQAAPGSVIEVEPAEQREAGGRLGLQLYQP